MLEAVTTDWIMVFILIFSWFLIKRGLCNGKKKQKGQKS